MSKVFVIKEPSRWNEVKQMREPTLDLTPAARYGELVFLLPPGRSPMTPQPIIKVMREKLRGYSDDDYLLPVGDPALIAIASAVASDANRGHLRILCWDKREGLYLVSDAWTRSQPVMAGDI